MLQKFNKEFKKSLLDIVKLEELPAYLEYQTFSQLLCDICHLRPPNLAYQYDPRDNAIYLQGAQDGLAPSERKCINDLWGYLVDCQEIKAIKSGDQGQDQLPSVGDVRLLLMAVFSIKGSKRLGIDATSSLGASGSQVIDVKIQAMQRDIIDESLPFGWFNDQNQLCLSTADITKVQKQFGLLNLNRINSKG